MLRAQGWRSTLTLEGQDVGPHILKPQARPQNPAQFLNLKSGLRIQKAMTEADHTALHRFRRTPEASKLISVLLHGSSTKEAASM